MRRHSVIALTMWLLLAAVVATGQETTGGIRGTVTDPSGAAVPNATVEASSPSLVRAQRTTTDATGSYIFPSLPPGTYTITVTAHGFRTLEQSGIVLQVGRLLTVDARLEVGAVTESVTVSATPALIDVSQSGSATNVNVSFFEFLPKSRSFDMLIELAPGARREPKQGAAGYQVDGSSGSENVFVIDGVEVTDLQHGNLPTASRVPMEFVSELQVKSSGFEAQYGGATGGVVNTILRSGSNEFHGQFSLYHETDGMNAGPRPTLRAPSPLNDNIADYFHNKRDGLRFLNPGFSLGGPFWKDKIWFFGSYFPAMWRYDRRVTEQRFRDYSHVVWFRRDRQDWLTAKLDIAPASRLRTYVSYVYSPYKVNGLLPSQQGTDNPQAPWPDRGYRSPGATYAYGADFTATNRLLFSVRGGYNYRNYKDYGIPRGTRYRFANTNTNLPPDLPVPPNLQGPAGDFTPNNFQTVKDIQTRWNLSADGTWITSLGGQHSFKFGYQTNRLHNDVFSGWPDGYIFLYWNRTRIGITVPGTMRGKYGYYIDRFFATTGDVGSDNTSFYIQDGWNVHPRLRLNLGLRFEREFLPSFSADPRIPGRAIEFGFGEKVAPRLGFALDLFGNTKTKLYGAFGLFYDMMKYEMPRGSFGGDKWHDRVYPLDDPDFFKIKPLPLGQTNPNVFEVVDWRIPSNDPNDNTIDPNLKPMRIRVWDFGVEHALTSTLVLNARYTRRRLDRTIEDVGILTPQGEKYFIANPGFGITADPKTWGPGIPVTPKAKRDYDAMELRLDHRFGRTLVFQASYTLSRLWGNYAGLASSDENGRQSPNVNRYFDLPFMSYDARGQLVYGRLATDRPHAFKLFGSYIFRSRAGETRFSPVWFLMSGTPLTTEVYAVSSVPIFVNGRGDMGRTPVFSNLDLAVTHEFHIKSDRYRAKVGFEFFNLFNQSTVTDRYVRYTHPNDGQIAFEHEADFFKGFDYRKMMAQQGIRVAPGYGWASSFQGPRTVRLGIHFSF